MIPGSRIDQILAGAAIGDATTQSALIVRETLRSMGYRSDLYAPGDRIMPELAAQCRDLADYRAETRYGVIHHYGVWSPAAEVYMGAAERKILVYHNVTPPHFFKGYSDRMVALLDEARRRLPEVARASRDIWAVSDFNAGELRSLGFTGVKVFPLPFRRDALTAKPDPGILAKLAAPLTTFLTVGRLAPNKRIERLLRAFAWYHHAINPFSRLVIVGSQHSAPRYVAYLRWLAHELKTPNIDMEGFVWPEALAAYYQRADLLVSTSDHEGYCAPLLEAMHYGVPVLAHDIGGIPEALGGAGARYRELPPRLLGELMHTLTEKDILRRAVLASQEKRLHELDARRIDSELRDLLNHQP